ncbi:protein GCY [Mrakia frigida]|uniref:protein GCY n=1 Tax=Mrakia frigida TaxID=29902 RepID=UPI003FCC1089
MSTTTIPSFKLNTGADIPAIGLGTWQSKPGEVREAVKVALETGYRHLDCAWAYKNEAEVGQGIKDSGVPRSEIFITTKIFVSNYYPDRLEKSLDESLSLLGVDYVDLLLLHWPIALRPNAADDFIPLKPDGTRDTNLDLDINREVYPLLEAVYKKGKARAIGVSNWSVPKLEDLLTVCKVKPAVNQVELHPYLPQPKLVAFCQSNDILVQAYSPLGSSGSPVREDEEVVKIAKKHGVDAGTVLISFAVKRDIVVLPKSVTASRIKANLALVDLDAEDMKTLLGLSDVRGVTRYTKGAWGVKFGFEDGF